MSSISLDPIQVSVNVKDQKDKSIRSESLTVLFMGFSEISRSNYRSFSSATCRYSRYGGTP